MNTHVKYQSSSTHCSEIIEEHKVFKKWVKLKGQGHMVKTNECSVTRILMLNIKALELIVQKLLTMLEFSKRSANSKVKNIGTNRNISLLGIFK